MAVKFIQSTQVGTLYNVDDIAGFDAKTEAELIKAEVAVAYKAEKPKPEDKPGA